jgi:hypothetical protein
MADWGIGLGAFTTGAAAGFGLGEKIVSSRQTRELNEQRLKSGEYTLQGQEREKQAADRAEKVRVGEQEILNPPPVAQPAPAVDDNGNPAPANAAQEPSEYSKYTAMGQKLGAFYRQNGLYDKAIQAEKVFDDKKNRIKLDQMGVVVGNLEDSLRTGDFSQLGGNMGTFFNDLPAGARQDMTFKNLDVKKGDDGKVVGIAMTMKGKDGKEVIHNWSDEASFAGAMHGWLNPVHLIDQLTAKTAAERKYNVDIATDLAKKHNANVAGAEKRELGLDGKSMATEFDDARKVVAAENQSTWGKMTPMERDEATNRYLASKDASRKFRSTVAPGIAGGGRSMPAPSAGKVIIDTKTGKPVNAPEAAGPPMPGAASPAEGGAATAPKAPAADPASVTAPAPSRAPAVAPPNLTQSQNTGGQDLSAMFTTPAAPAPAVDVQAAPGIAAAPLPSGGAVPVKNASPYRAPLQELGERGRVSTNGAPGIDIGGAISNAASSAADTVGNMPEVRAVAAAGRGAIDTGKKVADAISKAIPQIGKGRLDQINAARRSANLPALDSLGDASSFVAGGGKPEGLVKPGNIDINDRPPVKNSDGSVSTVRSITITVGDKAVLIPTVVGGRVVSNAEAIAHFKQTGQNLGMFKDEGSADAYAEKLHQQQAAMSAPKGKGKAKPAAVYEPAP